MFEILVDICMVELDAGKNNMARPVVEELRSFVKKGCVVLISFDDNVIALADSPSVAKIERHAADEKSGI